MDPGSKDDAVALQVFLQHASHDLREPLRHVISFAEILQEEEYQRLSADGRLYLDSIVSAGSRLQEMLAGLLAIARVQTRGKPLQRCELSPLLASAQRTLGAAADGASIEIAELPAVHGDADQLTALFEELLRNALKFGAADQAARIRVSAEQPAGAAHARITVEDQGLGLAPEQLERAFQIFQRFQPTATHPGAGAGLALCRSICERHGGTIRIESAPGGPTRVQVELPLAEPE